MQYSKEAELESIDEEVRELHWIRLKTKEVDKFKLFGIRWAGRRPSIISDTLIRISGSKNAEYDFSHCMSS